jgi:hypothetical protein
MLIITVCLHQIATILESSITTQFGKSIINLVIKYHIYNMDKNYNEQFIKIKIKPTKFNDDLRVKVTSFKKVLARLNQINFGFYKELLPATFFALIDFCDFLSVYVTN